MPLTTRPSVAVRILVGAVRLYQLIPSGPVPRCRFLPTCSEYAAEALRRHGATRGLVLIVRRLGRCHPFHPGGFDPVPGGAEADAGAADAAPREGATA
jgi:uncharacterized protein